MQPAVPRRSGRGLIWLGVLCAFLGAPLYVAQLMLWGQTVTPWYAPILASLGAGLIILSLRRRRTVWRGLALALVLFIAIGNWWFLASYARLPSYVGPVVSGEPFPDFRAHRANGTPFARTDLVGDKATALVFFRGHW